MKIPKPNGLLPAALLLVLSSVASAAPAVTSTHATVKIRPTDAAPPDLPADLVAARNEFVSFQIVVSGGDTGVNGVSAEVRPLSGPGTLGTENVSLYREAYLELSQMSFPDATPGRYPDALVPDVDEMHREKRNAFPFSVPPNETRVIWVDVLVPTGTEPGRYEGTVLVTGEGLEQTVPWSLSVVDAELPSTASLKSAYLFNHFESCMAHGGVNDCGGDQPAAELRTLYGRFALDHRVTLSNITKQPATPDWATFDAHYGALLDGTASTRLPGAKMTSVQYMGPRTPEGFAAFAEHMKARGWLDRAYDYTGDEPPYGISYGEALSRAAQVKQAAPELRTLLTATIQQTNENGLTQYLDLVVPVINYLDGNEAPYVGPQRSHYDSFLAEDPQNELWTYQSCMSHGCAYGTTAPGNDASGGWPSYMVDASASRNRAMQWVAFLQNVTGELYYETALAMPTAWNSVFRFAGNGDGTLFYPGTPAQIGGTKDTPVASFRLKQIRQGMQDYEWLKLVADAGDPEFARQVARTLIPSAHDVSDDGLAFENARRKLIARWYELTHPDAGKITSPGETDPGTYIPLFPGGEGLSPNAKRKAIAGATSCTATGAGVPFGALLFGAAALLARRRR